MPIVELSIIPKDFAHTYNNNYVHAHISIIHRRTGQDTT